MNNESNEITPEEQLRKQITDLQIQLTRTQREFANFRRRSATERQEFIQFAAAEGMSQLLPILDNFERALAHQTNDPEYAYGIELIYKRLLGTLQQAGLEPIDTEGKIFDPLQHQAVDSIPSTDYADQYIISQHLRGYSFRGKLLRPAMVTVVVHPPSNSTEEVNVT